MDPVTLIVAALAAGAATGLGDTASTAVKDGYGVQAGDHNVQLNQFTTPPPQEADLPGQRRS
jgi:hypothetical protein